MRLYAVALLAALAPSTLLAQAKAAEVPATDIASALVARIDADNDGALSLADVAVAALKTSEADENRDGTVDVREKYAYASAYAEAIQTADADDSGSASKDELVAWVAAVAAGQTPLCSEADCAKRAETLVKLLDADNDGKLAPVEIPAGFDTTWDTDSDKTLSVTEAIAGLTRRFKQERDALAIMQRAADAASLPAPAAGSPSGN